MRNAQYPAADMFTQCVLMIVASLALQACGGEGTPAPSAGSPPVSAAADSAGVALDTPIDACALLTQAEVETVTGHSVLAPVGEHMANLSTCAFGDPGAPVVNGRALSQTVSLSVFAGHEGEYHAGPIAQARDAYQMGRDNAASVEAVSGLGDDAYWDSILRTLNVLSGKYEVEVEISSDAGGKEVAHTLVLKVMPRLP